MEHIIIILKPFLLAWLITSFEPLQEFVSVTINPLLKRIFHRGCNRTLWSVCGSYLMNALSCPKCWSFWLSLAIYMNVYYAVASAILAYVFEKVMGQFKTKI